MRVLQSGIYNNFIQDQSTAKANIDRLTTQISSGKKIQNSYEDTSVYADTLRLDSEINALKGIQNRTEKSMVLTNASDLAMNDMDLTMIDFKSKLIQAANGTMNKENLENMAEELELSKQHLMTLANSSVNGQYIFSGSATSVKPIDSNGNYHGNADSLKTQISESSVAPYSVDGESLFLGFDNSVKKSVSTNVPLQNQTTNETLTASDTVEDLLGSASAGTFYLSGVKHDGEAFKEKITLNSSDTMSQLLTRIENAYSPTSVQAELSENGTIMISDNNKGNSKLDFQMTASTENVTDTTTLTTKIDFTSINGSSSDDRAAFNKEGNFLTGNVPLLYGDGFATNSTKLSELSASSLDSTDFNMVITDVNGVDKTVTLDLSATSTFTINGDTYDIFNADDTTPASADDFTIGQLNNIVSMVMADRLPDNGGISEAREIVNVSLNAQGKLEIEDKSANNNDISFSLFDAKTTDFSSTTGTLSFMSNQAVVIDNPKIDFFKDLDTIIEAVRNSILGVGDNETNPKNPGLANALSKLDSLTAHISKSHTKIGAMSNNLQSANDRASTLELNVTQIKSQITDVDLAEAIVQYEQVSLNYQAMMSTIAKVNSLTLLNYLK